MEMARTRVARPGHVDPLMYYEHRGAEHTTDRHGETRTGVLGSGRRVGIAAVPDIAAPRGACREPMDEDCGERAGPCQEQQDDEPVVGAAAFCDGHDPG